MNTRENWIDWAKTIGILLVVMGHLDISLTGANTLISAFHMPLFFVISGYLSSNQLVTPPPSRLGKSYHIKLAKTLLMPYLIYQILNYPYWLYAAYKMGRLADPELFDLVVKPINGILIGNAGDTSYSSMICGPMWFVMALFVLKFGFGYLSRLKDRYILLSCFIAPAIVVLLRAADLRLIFSADCALLALPFFCAGYWMKKYGVLDKLKFGALKWLGAAIFFGIILVLSTKMNGFAFMAGAQYGHNILLFFMQAFSGIFLVFAVCLILKNIQKAPVIHISNGTLFILGLQGMTLSIIRQYILIRGLHIDFEGFSLPGQFALQFMVGIVVLAILYIPMVWAEKRCPVLVGKLPKK